MEEEKKAEKVEVSPTKGSPKKGKKGKEEKPDPDELSPEDQALKEGLDLAVTRTRDQEPGVVTIALEHLRSTIRSATTSMTSVPKPLKFLRPHYAELKSVHAAMVDGDTRKELADIISVLAMTMAPEERESLSFKLKGNPADLGAWGHEYVRSLTGEIGQEYNSRSIANAEAGKGDANEDILELVRVILPFHLQHKSEAEAVDLLVEVQQLPLLLKAGAAIDDANYQRVCLYLLRTADFMADPEDLAEILGTAFDIYTAQKAWAEALRVALRMGDNERVAATMAGCSDATAKQQMAFILARHRASYVDEEDDELNNLIGNEKLSECFLHLARDVDVMEPKTPEDIYKSHLGETAKFVRRKDAAKQVDSASSNLASTFVNGFVNAGFGTDKLMSDEETQWVFKNKEHGMLSAVASLGLIHLWDVDEGLNKIDKFAYYKEDYVKAGAVLAFGVVTSGVRNESDPTLALLPEHLESGSSIVKCAALEAFGIAYAGSAREDVSEYLVPVVANTEGADMAQVALAALSLGHIFVGTCHEEVGSCLVERLMESSDEELDHPMARFLALGLALVFFGRMERADAMLEAVKTVEHKIGKYAAVCLESCAYAGSGNVLKIQELLGMCAEHLKEDADHQAAAVLGIALVSLGEDVGSEMVLRAMDHLLHYCELPIKRAVPLALALLNVSNPDYAFVDQMSRLSHDSDSEVAQAAIMGLGLLGAGTNNSRVAGILRTLAEHSPDRDHTFVVRIAQGLLHMGKGLIGLSPFHSDRLLVSGAGMAGLLTVLHACLDFKRTLLDKVHYLLFYLTGAMNPRMLMTVEEETLEPTGVGVRVGQAVEVVGQAGRPKTISGFQSHTTPVPLAVTERAELAGDEFMFEGSSLEGIVILKKNPDFEADNGSS